MAIEDDIRLFSIVPFLQGFGPEALRLLAFGSERLVLRPGRELYRANQAADCGFVVSSGEIELSSETENGKQDHGRFGRGALLGELALIASARRPVNATAVTEAEVIRISRSVFMRILGEYPDIAAKLHQRISAELSGMASKVAALGPRFSD
jgi:CRP-like cAMP-binding protein